MNGPGPVEKAIYTEICTRDGIKAKDIAKNLGLDRSLVNRQLYASPLMRELCRQDDACRWHGLIRQARPHDGLFEFCGWYSTVPEFLATGEEDWLASLKQGCDYIGRSLNDNRGLFHSFTDCRSTVLRLFADLRELGGPDYSEWEIVFELRIKKSRYIRIYADVLIITGDRVFSMEFKMKDKVEPSEVQQAAKYCEYEDLIFGKGYDIVPVLVLTGAKELFRFEDVPGSDAAVLVCAGDLLYNAFDYYYGFLQ